MKLKRIKPYQLPFHHTLKRLMKRTLFLKNFALLFGIMSLSFLCFSLYIYRQSISVLERELVSSSKYRLETASQSIDNYISDLQYQSAVLEDNNMVQSYFRTHTNTTFYAELQERIRELLTALVYGNSAIDSVYLYSGKRDSILSTQGEFPFSSWSDNTWVEYLDLEPDHFYHFFRSKNNAYPYLLTVMKVLDTGDEVSAIIINVDLNKLSHLQEISNVSYQDIFILSDTGDILFRNNQRNLIEPLETVPQLVHFQKENASYSYITSDATDTYVYAQHHSSKYPWYYVTVTHLQDYNALLSDSRATFAALFCSLLFVALLFSLLFSLRSVRPIHSLSVFLQNPTEVLSADFYNDNEIRTLAGNIASYLQINNKLSEELNTQLNLLTETKLLALQSQINPHFLFNTLNIIHMQECSALGFQHPLPKLTLNLSRILQYALNSTDLVTLETELEYTKIYISILQERYDHLLQFIYDINENIYCAKVPKLFIQPIIENAIFHGLAEKAKEGKGILTLTCQIDNNDCVVTITDNGVGMPPETLERIRRLSENLSFPKTNIGLKNVIVRMSLLYKERLSIQIDSTQGEGSCFTLRFPFMH